MCADTSIKVKMLSRNFKMLNFLYSPVYLQDGIKSNRSSSQQCLKLASLFQFLIQECIKMHPFEVFICISANYIINCISWNTFISHSLQRYIKRCSERSLNLPDPVGHFSVIAGAGMYGRISSTWNSDSGKTVEKL